MTFKGDFQLSLGFIIAVVFAIVLLSLALTWLRGVFENVLGLTDDLTQEAHSTLRESFRTTSTDFAIWPSQYEVNPGKGLKMSAGIENDATDGLDHTFVINVIPVGVSDNICAGGGLNCPVPGGAGTLATSLRTWLTFDQTPGLIKINAVGFRFIEVRPANNAPKGTYIFNIVACYDKPAAVPASASCTPTHPNLWGGSAQQLIISVK